MWWRILVALLLTLPPVAYVAGALSGEVEDRTPRPTVVLPTGEGERSPGFRDRNEGDRNGGEGQGPRQRPGHTGDADNDDRPGGVTVVRPDPVTVGENGGDDDHDDGDDADDTDDVDDD